MTTRSATIVAALVVAVSACGNGGEPDVAATSPGPTAPTASPSPTTDTAPPPEAGGPSPAETPQPAIVPGPATTEVATQDHDGSMLAVTDLRVSGHDTFDRIVFEIAGEGDVGWRIEYDDDPRSQGSGNPVSVDGDAVLRVALIGIAYPGDAPGEPRQGPERIRPTDTDVIVEVLDDTIFEARHEFFVGLREVRPYRVAALDDPQRLVIDVETR